MSASPRPAPIAYAEFGLRSNFSFLEGASHPEEIALMAQSLGLSAIGLADRNSVAGVVRLHMAAKEAGLAYHPGARLVFADGTPDLLAYPKNRAGWAGLCRLLSLGNLRAEKGRCHLLLEDLADWSTHLALVVVPPAEAHADPAFPARLQAIAAAAGSRVFLALVPAYDGLDQWRFESLVALAAKARMTPMASNDVLYHAPDRRPLADVVTAIRHHVPIASAGFRLKPNAERHLKSPVDMARLFRDHPDALLATLAFDRLLQFSLDELRYEYPDEAIPGETPAETLRRLTFEGARARYPDGIPDKVVRQIAYELKLIRELDYEPYFLTVWDIVRFARSRGILCQGRGSAANSTVCFCIGITEVDPALADLLFERFISPDRREPPDIDVDFEHERREEVIQYIYAKYGRERAGLAAAVTTYRARSAGREVAKAFGLSEDAQSALTGTIWGWSSSDLSEREAKAAGLDMRDETTTRILAYASLLTSFPRHLTQHSGGFVITRSRLDEVVPVMNTAMDGRTMVEWDKDDLDSLGILKIDILALGMLTCLKRGLDLLEQHYGVSHSLATMPKEQAPVYDMICRADTIGVFQIESRAQMTMLPRLRPREFYDLVIEVAIVRPGPIQGDMVHPYLRRRQGKERPTYPKPELEAVLKKTLGVPLFQEQAMKIAIVAAGFTPSEADKLRRAMATFRRVGTIHSFQQKMIAGMVANGYEADFAERCFRQIEGFGEYGFPESHAASFALLVYASCWLKTYYPDVFCAAILNAQPMGFYAPSQLVRDAREHGVEVRPVDVNHSDWDSTLEESSFDPRRIAWRHREMKNVIRSRKAVRLGFRQVKGLSEPELRKLVTARDRPFLTLRDVWLRSGLSKAAMERLADADAFRSMGLSRREALWAVRALDGRSSAESLPLFARVETGDLQKEPAVTLPRMPAGEEVIEDYRALSLSLKAHPLSFLRNDLARRGVLTAAALEQERQGRRVEVAGLVLVRQRPGSAKGVVFMTLEDETGVANIIVWPKILETFRPIVLGARLVTVRGRLQKADGVIHVVAEHLEDRTAALGLLKADLKDFGGLAPADEVRRPVIEQRNRPKILPGPQEPVAARDRSDEAVEMSRLMPKGRNFH